MIRHVPCLLQHFNSFCLSSVFCKFTVAYDGGGLLQMGYFDDPPVLCLLSLDSIDSKDLTQKSEFFQQLVHYIPHLPAVSQSAECRPI